MTTVQPNHQITAPQGGRSVIRTISGILLMLTLFFLPTGVAVFRRHPHGVWIFLINFFFGAFLPVWVFDLVWAFNSYLFSNNPLVPPTAPPPPPAGTPPPPSAPPPPPPSAPPPPPPSASPPSAGA